MKIYQALYLIISSFFFLFSVANASSIDISGTVIEKACNIQAPNEIDIGKYARASFSNWSDIAVTTFNIELLGCSNKKQKIIITSKGDYDSSDTVLTNRGTAENVSIYLLVKKPGAEYPTPLEPKNAFEWEIKDGPIPVEVYLYPWEGQVIKAGTFDSFYQFEVSYP